MNKIKNIVFKLSLLLMAAVLVQSCVKTEIDEPDEYNPPVGDVLTIEELKDLCVGDKFSIQEDISVYATVTMDDKSGNIYKQAYVQDSTGAILLNLDAGGSLLMGQQIRLYLNGAILVNGSNDLISLDSLNAFKNVIRTAHSKFIEPEVTTIDQIKLGKFENILVKIVDAQFEDAELGNTFANAITSASENRMLEDCDENSVIVRTSGYANFAATTVPEGKGEFIAIASLYRGDPQLLVRDIEELIMNGVRCDGSGGGGQTGDPVDFIDEQFNNAENYTDIAIAGWQTFATAGDRNWQGKIFNESEKYAQATGHNSGLSAMVTWMITPPVNIFEDSKLSFSSAMAFWSHTTTPFEVLVSTDYTGENVETATWTALNATTASENDEDHTWIESGDIDLSAYVNSAIHIAFRYTGSDSESTSIRIDNIKVSTDNGGGGGGGSFAGLSEEFATTLGNFSIYDVDGSQEWEWANYGGGCAKMSGYDGSQYLNEDWLISPAVDMTDHTGAILNVSQAVGYLNDQWEQIAILVSSDYTGSGDPYAATWTEVIVPNMPSGVDFIFVDSGDIDISAFDGQTIYVGFKYLSTSDNASTWEIGSVVVK